jgi:hypothetical protein
MPPRSHLRPLSPFSIQLTRRNTLQMQFEKFSSFSDISSAVSSDSSEVQLCGSSPLPPTSHNLSFRDPLPSLLATDCLSQHLIFLCP